MRCGCNSVLTVFTSSCTGGQVDVEDEASGFVCCRTVFFFFWPSLVLIREMEGIGLLEVFSWIKESEYRNMIFESNAKGVVDALYGR